MTDAQEDAARAQRRQRHRDRLLAAGLKPAEIAVEGHKRARRASSLLDASTFTTGARRAPATRTPSSPHPQEQQQQQQQPQQQEQEQEQQQQEQPAHKRGRKSRGSTRASTAPATAATVPEALRGCYDVVRALARCPEASAFLAPVDPDAQGLPDYRAVVARPMDLGTVRHNLERGAYASAAACDADVRLTFDNALAYNACGHPLHACAAALRDAYAALRARSPGPAPSAADVAACVKACHAVRAAEDRERAYEHALRTELAGAAPVDSAARHVLAARLADATGATAADVAHVLARRVCVASPHAFDRPQDSSDCAEVAFDQLDQLTVQAVQQCFGAQN